MSDSLQPYGLKPARLFHPWDFPGKNTGAGYHFLLQGTFQTQGSNLGLLRCGQTLYHLSHQGIPLITVSMGNSVRPLTHWLSLKRSVDELLSLANSKNKLIKYYELEMNFHDC